MIIHSYTYFISAIIVVVSDSPVARPAFDVGRGGGMMESVGDTIAEMAPFPSSPLKRRWR